MFLRNSTSQVIRFGPFLDSTDGVTPETALTIAQADMQLSKDGGAFAQKAAAGNATHDTDGWYSTTLDTTDTNTNGELIMQINVSGALPVWVKYYIVPASTYDALTTNGLNNVAATDIVSAGAITTSSGAVSSVTTVATCTTNTDMRGTDNALLASSAPTNFGDLAITATTGLVSVGTNNDKTGYSISGTKTTLDALNDIAATSIVSGGAINTTAGAVDNVTLVATTTTNTDMRGTDSALLASSVPTNFSDLAITAATGQVTIGTNNDKAGYSLTQTFPANFADMAITATTGQVTVGTNNDKAGYSISGSITTLDGLNNFNPTTDTVANVTNVTSELNVNVAKINGVTITGNGSTTPFDV